MYHNICSYHNVYVFFFLLLSSLFCQPYTFLFFSSILPICCSHLWPPVFSTIVVYYLSSSLTKEVVSRWSLVRYIGSIVSLLISKPHMVDAKPYLISSLSNYCYANLHELLIKSILSYHLLWHPIFLSLSRL
jgi:hypothetical protein